MKKQQTVPIVQQDLSHEETIVQIAFSLDVLEKIISNIFSNVEYAIEKKKKRLHNIQCRCEIAQHKVKKLANIRNSIKVFSCYKYPGPRAELFYKDPLYNVIEIDEPIIKIKCSTLSHDKYSLKEKLKFYHVRDHTRTLKKYCETTPFEGLGSLPKNSKINSVLLFNTNYNLYKQYKIVDPLCSTAKPSDSSVKNVINTIVEIDPISINSNEHLGYKNIHNYFYSPKIQDVPDIEAPLNLPRLTGIAGDLKYNEGQSHVSVENEEASVFKETIVAVGTHVSEKSTQEYGVLEPSPALPPPPMPPPPPLPPPASFESDQVPEQSNTDAGTSINSDARANLMEAIRQAGGKSRLKHVNHEKPPQSTPQGKSLMDDLHEKLHMRRKGISGKIDNAEGMLDRIVSMIPPPPAPVKQQEDDDDEDWDD